MSEQYKNGLWNLLLEGSPDNPMTAMDMMLARHRQRIEKAAMQNAEPNSSIRNVPDNAFQSWLNESGQRLMNPTDTIAQGVKDFTGQSDVDMGLGLMGGGVGATVWHGSPHTFGKFDASKIGTGEGAQAYGHGLYVADARKVGQQYKDDVSDAFHAREIFPRESLKSTLVSRLSQDQNVIRGNKHLSPQERQDIHRQIKSIDDEIHTIKQAFDPSLYKIDLPDEHIAKMLDWDKPLSQQHPDVQSALEKLMPKGAVSPHNLDMGGGKILDNRMGQADPTQVQPWVLQSGSAKFGLTQKDVDRMVAEHGEGTNGQNAYTRMTGSMGGQKNASDALQQAGIPGIKYLDGGSRGVGEGSSNYVVFPGNEDMLNILERNGQKIK